MRHLLPILFLIGVTGCSANSQRYENLHNPTEYLFSASKERVMEILRDRDRRLTPPPEPLHGAFDTSGDAYYHFSFDEVYTNRYWTARRETKHEVEPPEAGRIGIIDGDFNVRMIPKGEDQTLVTVTVVHFRQQVGRHYAIFPHFHKTGTRADVKSDTYYEYLFLLKLGELLGEKNMPPLKGSGVGDTYSEDGRPAS
jgi:hypothetical protein